MSTLIGSGLPHDTITEVAFDAPAVPETMNVPLGELLENVQWLATGQLIVVDTRAELSGHPDGEVGAAPLAFVVTERALYAYDPRDPEDGADTGRPGVGGATAAQVGEVTVPTNDGRRWVRLNASRSLFYSEVSATVDTDLVTPTKDLGLSVAIVCDGVLPVEVRLSMDFTGKDGYDGAVQLVDGATVIATRDVAEGTLWVEMTKVIIPTAGLHTFTARLTHGTTGANTRALTVRRG